MDGRGFLQNRRQIEKWSIYFGMAPFKSVFMIYIKAFNVQCNNKTLGPN